MPLAFYVVLFQEKHANFDAKMLKNGWNFAKSCEFSSQQKSKNIKENIPKSVLRTPTQPYHGLLGYSFKIPLYMYAKKLREN